uniref:Putative secreted protein n=1 Tax=Anopheles darlingi TaxID=43151 RepID=A0A2M4DLK9_ANODA
MPIYHHEVFFFVAIAICFPFTSVLLASNSSSSNSRRCSLYTFSAISWYRAGPGHCTHSLHCARESRKERWIERKIENERENEPQKGNGVREERPCP